MATANELGLLSDHAQAILKDIKPLREDSRPTVKALVTQIDEAVQKVVQSAASPVRIGVVGQFDAGKTLLLGSIMGYGDALPVSSVPTTGNITALRFVQHGDSKPKTTEVGPFHIEYLSRSGVQDCLAHMLEEAARRAQAARLPDERLRELERLELDRPDLWEALEGWCKGAWAEANQNPSLLYLLAELARFSRCYTAYGTLMCGKTFSDVAADIAQRGLTLTSAPAPDDIRQQRFDELPPPPQKLSTEPESLTAELLRDTFSLIRRCTVQIRVSKSIWNLSALSGENELVLLDFPGLGADSSGVRDRYLCIRELEEVQTILILLNSVLPGAGGVLEIYDMMQRKRRDLSDSILVGVGRFDQLPLSHDQLEELACLGKPSDLDQGTAEEVTPLDGIDDLARLFEQPQPIEITEAEVYDKLSPLQRVISNARSFTTRVDRVVLLSPMLALGDLRDRYPELQVGSNSLLHDLGAALPAARERREQWSALSEQLRTAGQSGHLSRWLLELGQEGGVGALRELLQRHVQTHGMSQIYEHVLQQVFALDGLVRQLCDDLQAQVTSTPSPTVEGPFAEVGAALRRLLREYNQLKVEYTVRPPDLRIPVDGKPTRLVQQIHEEVVKRIFAWPEWQRLLNRVRDGYIEPRDDEEGLLTSLGDGSEPDLPTNSEHIRNTFELTFREMEGLARTQTERAIKVWLEELFQRIGPMRKALRPFTTGDVSARLAESHGKKAVLLQYLQWALDPLKMQEGLIKQCRVRSEFDQELIDRAFPLPKERIFAWDPGMKELCPMQMRHQTIVMRLRDECIVSTSRELTELVSQVNNKATKLIVDAFKQISERLQEILILPGFVDVVAGMDHTAAANVNDEGDLLEEHLRFRLSASPAASD
jgi:hypothetical protein